MIIFLSQCNAGRKIRAAFPGETQIFFLLSPCPVYRVFRVSIPPEAYYTLLRQLDMGYLTCTHIWTRAVHKCLCNIFSPCVQLPNKSHFKFSLNKNNNKLCGNVNNNIMIILLSIILNSIHNNYYYSEDLYIIAPHLLQYEP